jgi:hypothetical protein
MSIGFITWGTKTTLKRVGYVADFCPICRRTTVCSSIAVGNVKHIQRIPLGKATTIGHILRCSSCNLPMLTDIDRYHCNIPRSMVKIDRAIDDTFPNIEEFYRDRLAIERDIRTDPFALPPQTRSVLIDEPFSLLSPNRPAQKVIAEVEDRWFWQMLLIAICCVAVFQHSRTLAFGSFFLAFVIYWTLRANIRQQQHRAMLASALAPLQPTTAEITAAANRWKMSDVEVRKLIKSIERPLLDSVYLI